MVERSDARGQVEISETPKICHKTIDVLAGGHEGKAGRLQDDTSDERIALLQISQLKDEAHVTDALIDTLLLICMYGLVQTKMRYNAWRRKRL